MQLKITENYLDDLMVRMAHHSTAIEGNSLTQGETKSLLIDGYIPRAMNLREFNEVHNYKDAMPFLMRNLKDKHPIDIAFIKETHSILCREAIEGVAGKFKTIPNMVIGASFIPTPPYMITPALENWRLNLEAQLNASTTMRQKIEAICRQHINFEQIHPFSDGNGRAGRFLMVYSCLQEHLPAINIPVERKQEYIYFLNENNSIGLAEFALECIKQEIARLECFQHNERSIWNVQAN